MGMFDKVRCDYPIDGDTFRDCQTKTIDPEFGGTMDLYYIDPVGTVWQVDYSGTAEYRRGRIRPDENRVLPFFRRIATGKHGRVRLADLTGYVVIYPSDYEGPWEEWPEVRLHIVKGKVQSYALKQKGEPCYRD